MTEQQKKGQNSLCDQTHKVKRKKLKNLKCDQLKKTQNVTKLKN